MNFDMFLKSLVKVAEIKHPREPAHAAFKLLLETHLLPFTHSLASPNAEAAPLLLFDELVHILLRDTGKSLLEVYQRYF